MSDKNIQELILKGLDDLKASQSETTKCVNELTTEFKLHKQESNNRWDAIKKLDEEQNALLAEHSARSYAIQKDVKLREEALRFEIFGKNGLEPRVSKLEEPTKLKKAIFQKTKFYAAWIASVGGAIVILMKILESLGYL